MAHTPKVQTTPIKSNQGQDVTKKEICRNDSNELDHDNFPVHGRIYHRGCNCMAWLHQQTRPTHPRET